MKIAIQYEDLTVDSDGHVEGHEAGDTLVRRLLRVFPGAQLIGNKVHRYPDFDMVPVEMIDGDNTVLINMDAINSVELYRKIKGSGCAKPRIMNFIWWNATRFSDDAELYELALSCALFPTFANSDRSIHVVQDLIQKRVIKPLFEQAKVSGANLGIRMEHVQPRVATDVPIVLYPAIYMDSRKQPGLFFDIVSKVNKRVPIKVEARLAEQHLISEAAMKLSRERWAHVSPLLPSRADYWKALGATTAFVATAEEESYGLEYVEALVAGVIGIFPDKDWAKAIVPSGYPFLYHSPAEAEEMLVKAVTSPDACRAQLDAAAGGSFSEWLHAHHNDDDFESEIAKRVTEWFGHLD